MEVSANARTVRSRSRNTQGFTVNTRYRDPPIHRLNDDELLHLFGLYLLDVRYEYDSGDDGIITPHWDRERLWYKLAQVCRRWRHLILESSNCLGLHLVCTYGTPVADMLAHSPPFPLIIIYLEKDREMTTEDEERILIALGPEYRDRARRIGLWMPASSSPKLITAMEEPFPNLESMLIMSATECSTSLILPNSFQAPSLRRLKLWGAALPLGSPPFDTFKDLVTLALSDIPQGTYLLPSDLITCLSFMPRLERLMIGFRSHLPNRDVEPLNTMPTTLPNLRWIAFKGNFNFRFIRVAFLAGSVVLATHPNGQDRLCPFTVTVRCNPVDWQVASIAQILEELQPILSNSEQLTLSYRDSEPSTLSERRSEFDRTWWRRFLGPFDNLRTLHVQDELVWELSQTLQSNGREPPTELLPNLKELVYSGGDARSAFTPFLNQRQVARHPVSLSTVRRWREGSRP
ncbi:hypothetical protein BJV78DRAFT_1197530 [Lactifluus subvellereus]|nr:hypothetical protein BJV78DRAFT_1197530 [Lactifluus subvellereus]